MKKFEGVLFDMDGVLVDSEPLTIAASIETIRDLHGFEAKPEDFVPYIGKGDDLFVGGVIEKYGGKYTVEAKNEMYSRYAKNEKAIKVFKNAEKAFSWLKDNGIKMAICSSSDIVKVTVNARVSKADQYVDKIISGSDVGRKKPFPDIYLMGAEKLGLDPKKCVVVEDAVSGVMAGKAAGCLVVAVKNTFEESKLIDAGADVVIDELGELIDVIKKYNG